MEEFDIVIIGGGASGAFCALNLNKNLKVALVDANLFPAKKLLVTGNGRCNLTNLTVKNNSYNTDISNFLNKFNADSAIKKFDELGLKTYADQENRVYPISNSAKSVVDVFCYHLNKNKNLKILQQQVQCITKQDNKYHVQTQDQTLITKNIVVATGGNTQNLLCEFDLETTQCVPSLVALKTKQKMDRLDGIRVSNVKVSCKTQNITYSEFGEILFKKDGLSGICILNISCMFARDKSFTGKVFVNLLPQYSYEKLFEILKTNFQIFDNALNALTPILHKQLAIELLYRSNLEQNQPCKQITDKQLNVLINNICKMEFDIKDCYNNQQVYCGGVKLESLDNTLQSKKHKGLYFCGEICDVDGLCGGYNLQWAWTSAFVVASAFGDR